MTSQPPFHKQLQYERERRGWSQADLAEKVGCGTKTVSRWERGENTPHPSSRQKISQLFGKNIEELGLTQGVSHSSPWQADQIDQSSLARENMSNQTIPSFLVEDWGEALYVANLYGRDEECATIEQWMTEQNCRIGVILGMGGTGKTTIATAVATRTKQKYEFLFWRSLQNAPPFEYLLKQCITFFSHQEYRDFPQEIDEQISLLLFYFRTHRCLLILDNFETLLITGHSAGHYRKEYAAYGRLLQRIGETQHQSYLLITSREKPKEVAQLEGKTSPVRLLYLSGLGLEACQQMLRDKELIGSDSHWLTLIRRYAGNPLALQIVVESIQEVFAGDIARFLEQETMVFGDIHDLVDQQFQRLSVREQEMMYWFAIEREPTSLEDLKEDLVDPLPIGILIEVLDSLRRRSLIEKRGPTEFALQPVIIEYITANLIERADIEFDIEEAEIWNHYVLSKARAKGYVRESQERILLAPLAQRLLRRLGIKGIEQRIRDLLTMQRQAHPLPSGYLAGNLLNLLIYLHYDLRGFDFSHLLIRQAYLQGVMLPEVNFAHARFVSSVFTNTFGNVLAIACNQQEHLFAVGTTSGEIRVYDTTYTLRLTCHGHTDGAWSLAFSPDGTLLASSSDDHTIRLWKSDSGFCLRTLPGHTNRVRAIAFSPDGTLLASGSDDQTIRLWNTHTGECIMELLGHTSRVWSVTFHRDGNLLASGSTDQTVRIWDLNTQSCLHILHGHSNWVRSVSFHPQNDLLASSSDDQTIRIWNINSNQCPKILSGHTNRVWSVAFNPEGNVLASGSEDQTIRLWDSATGNNLHLLYGHTQGIRSIAFFPGRPMLISGGDDQTIRAWDTSTGDCLQTMQGYTKRVWSIAFSSDGSMLAHGSEDSTICIWNSKTGQSLKVWQDRRHKVLAVAFASDNLRLASGGQDQTVRVWDRNTGRCLAQLEGHTNWVRTVEFSPDGKMLASGSEDQTIRLWDLSTNSCICTLPDHTSWVRSVAFSPDGKMLASGADDYTICLWDITDGHRINTLRGHTNRVRSVAFSPDGTMLASGSEDRTIRLWDLRSGQSFTSLEGHLSWLRSVAFSPDGAMLASCSEDGIIHLWDVGTWQCLQTLAGHSSRVRQVRFNPDGQTLASCGDDGMIKIWDRQTFVCLKTLITEKPYERMNIAHVQGLTVAQKTSLEMLGAITEDEA